MDEREKPGAPLKEEYSGPSNQKELFYESLIEKFHITKRGMDIALIVIAALFVFFVLWGYMDGNGLI